MRADRSSHGFTSVITSRFACAIGGRDVARYGDETVAEKNGLGTTTDPHRLSFSLGFTNQPFTYSAIPGVGPAMRNSQPSMKLPSLNMMPAPLDSRIRSQ